jgi:16S rRNA (adenine1518-N6/adenine1519-N6)-dimethyltransferase
MLQKEVGARLAAAPGSSAYSGLSVFFQYYASIQSCFDVPSQAFTPRPAVDSTVLRLDPFQTLPWPSPDEPFLFNFVKTAFAHRRKTLRKNLLSTPQWALTETDLSAIWDHLELSRTARPQELHPRQFVALAAAVQRLLSS